MLTWLQLPVYELESSDEDIIFVKSTPRSSTSAPRSSTSASLSSTSASLSSASGSSTSAPQTSRPSTSLAGSSSALPVPPSTQEEEEDFAIFLASQGELKSEDENEEPEPAPLRDEETIVSDLLLAAGDKELNAEEFEAHNSIIGYDSVGLDLRALIARSDLTLQPPPVPSRYQIAIE